MHLCSLIHYHHKRFVQKVLFSVIFFERVCFWQRDVYVIKIIHQSEIISLKHVGRLSPCFVTLSIPDFFVSQIEETIIDDQPLSPPWAQGSKWIFQAGCKFSQEKNSERNLLMPPSSLMLIPPDYLFWYFLGVQTDEQKLTLETKTSDWWIEELSFSPNLTRHHHHHQHRHHCHHRHRHHRHRHHRHEGAQTDE